MTTKMVRGSMVKRKNLRWLWRGYFPRGGFMLLEGDPDSGKTTLLMHVAARVSRCEPVIPPEMAHDEKALRSRFKKPRNVLVFCREESFESVLQPRFEAAGGNTQRIWFSREKAVFPEMLHIIEKEIMRRKAGLVILDPIMGYLLSRKEQEARDTLEALAEMAEEHDTCIVGIRHFPKTVSGSGLFAGIGSYAFTATARVVTLVAKSPDVNDGSRVLIVTKNNHVSEEDRPSMRFALDKLPRDVSRARFVGECDVTQRQVMAARKSTKDVGRPPVQREHAVDVLLDILAAGPVQQTELEVRAGVAGVSFSTIKRARKELHVKGYVIKVQQRTDSDGERAWWWCPPVNPPPGFVGRSVNTKEPPPFEPEPDEPEPDEFARQAPKVKLVRPED